MFTFPRISIVTPSFNQGQYIEQTILSIIGQGYPNLEYIIIDGGSKDNTVEIIKKYEKYISYWVSERDCGQSDALNKGLSRCTGDIFNWINSDDFLEKDSLFKVAAFFTNQPEVEIVSGWCILFNEEDCKDVLTHRTEIFNNVEETLVNQRINQPASFYKMGVVNKLGGLNSQLSYVMDLELWFRYLLSNGQKNILLIEDLLAHFRIHTSSKTMQQQKSFRNEERLLWHHLLSQLQVEQYLIDYFDGYGEYSSFPPLDCSKIDRKRLVNSICKKHLFDFYRSSNNTAARFALVNQLVRGNITLQKNYLGMFYNLFIRR